MSTPLFDEKTNLNDYTFKLKLKDERLRCFCKVKSLHSKLNDILSESNAKSSYKKEEPNVLYVTYLEKLTTKVPYMERIWRLRVRECIEYYLQVFKSEKLSLSFKQWEAIEKTPEITNNLLGKHQTDEDNDEFDDVSTIVGSTDEKQYAVYSVNKTSAKIVEIDIVGLNIEVDKCIVKIKVNIHSYIFIFFEYYDKCIIVT
jgi:hypothetical protein